MTGVVTKVILSKGYGFIRDSEGMSRFFHQRAVVDPMLFDRLHEGLHVRFIPTQDGEKDNRLRAVNVELVNAE